MIGAHILHDIIKYHKVKRRSRLPSGDALPVDWQPGASTEELDTPLTWVIHTPQRVGGRVVAAATRDPASSGFRSAD